MYTHVTIQVAYGRLTPFLETMPKVQAIVEQAGWVLKQALIQQNGRLFTVIHVWKLRDMNNYAEGIGLLLGHPDYPALIEVLSGVVESETIVFAVDAPYAPA
jgi:hypothetical protein